MAKRQLWKRSRVTTGVIYRIRAAIKEDGYEEEMSVVPLAKTLSVVARKDETFFNLRLDKDTLEIVAVYELKYNRRKDHVRRVFRRKIV